MTDLSRLPGARDLSVRSRALLWALLAVALLHHTDHVLRVDHSGWPFRSEMTPFTFSLIAYPVVLFALFGPAKLIWLRWAGAVAGAVSTIAAHTFVETPMMQYATWADGYSSDPASLGLPNLCGVASPEIGVAAVIVSMTLNLLTVAVSISTAWDATVGRRRATPA